MKDKERSQEAGTEKCWKRSGGIGGIGWGGIEGASYAKI